MTDVQTVEDLGWIKHHLTQALIHAQCYLAAEKLMEYHLSISIVDKSHREGVAIDMMKIAHSAISDPNHQCGLCEHMLGTNSECSLCHQHSVRVEEAKRRVLWNTTRKPS